MPVGLSLSRVSQGAPCPASMGQSEHTCAALRAGLTSHELLPLH